MKAQLLSFIFTLHLLATTKAQTTFQKTYGTADYEYGGSVQQTIDGGYVIAGSNTQGAWMIKTNEDGNMLWNKSFAAGSDALYVRETSDGGYILTGINNVGYNTVVIRTDSTGTVLWSKEFSTSGYDWGFACAQANDGGFVIAGAAGQDAELFKLDGNGNLLWLWGFDAGGYEEALDLRKTSDGGYCLAGYSDNDGLLIKTDSSGTLLWSKRYDFGLSDDAFSAQQCSDGGYIITGATGDFFSTEYDIYLLKTDDSGNPAWTKKYDATGWNFSQTVLQTTDHGYLIVGDKNYGTSNPDIWIIKTDSMGEIAWSKTYGGANEEIAWRSIAGEQTTDGGFLIGGRTWSFGSGTQDIYVIKTDADGNSGCNEIDFTPTVISVTVVATNPNLVVLTSGSLSTVSNTSSDSGVETELCFSSIMSAALSSSDTNVCEKFCIDFFDQSLGNPVAWQWSFEGGNPASSIDQNPASICYEDSGTFDVSLITTDASGNNDTLVLTDFIAVYANPFTPVITQNGNVLTCSNATSYQWHLNTVLIPGATNQSYTITQSGLYTVVIEDENGCQAQTDFDATWTSIENLSVSFQINIIPNPAFDQITVSVSSSMFHVSSLRIINLLDQQVLSSEVELDGETFSINIEPLPPGIYKVIVFGEEGIKQMSFVKQ